MSVFLQQSGIIAAIGFRLLMILSLWQGPVVWGHYHGEQGTSLAEHLARFHQGATQAECGHWHWHVTLAHRGPVEDHDSFPPGSPVIPQDLVSPVLIAPGAPLNFTAAVASDWGIPVVMKTEEFHWDLISASGFLSTYCPTHSPQEVLCRRQC